jgi:hypothetical protein
MSSIVDNLIRNMCMNYQIGKYYQIHHIVAHMNGDVVPRYSVTIMEILASCNIL